MSSEPSIISYNTILELAQNGKIDEAAETILNYKLSLSMVKWNLNMMDDKNDYSDFIAEVGDYLISKYILGDSFMESNCDC